MKIKINEYEEYNFNTPDEIDATELKVIVGKLSNILKIIEKDDSNVLFKGIKPQIKNNQQQPKRRNRFNREEAIKILKEYYKLRAKDQITSRDPFAKRAKYVKKQYPDIKPGEVGLKRFPILNEPIKNLMLDSERGFNESEKEK